MFRKRVLQKKQSKRTIVLSNGSLGFVALLRAEADEVVRSDPDNDAVLINNAFYEMDLLGSSNNVAGRETISPHAGQIESEYCYITHGGVINHVTADAATSCGGKPADTRPENSSNIYQSMSRTTSIESTENNLHRFGLVATSGNREPASNADLYDKARAWDQSEYAACREPASNGVYDLAQALNQSEYAAISDCQPIKSRAGSQFVAKRDGCPESMYVERSTLEEKISQSSAETTTPLTGIADVVYENTRKVAVDDDVITTPLHGAAAPFDEIVYEEVKITPLAK